MYYTVKGMLCFSGSCGVHFEKVFDISKANRGHIPKIIFP